MVTKSCAPLLNQPISENCLSNCLSLVPDNPSQVPNPSLGSPSLERTTRLWFRTACFRSRQPVSGLHNHLELNGLPQTHPTQHQFCSSAQHLPLGGLHPQPEIRDPHECKYPLAWSIYAPPKPLVSMWGLSQDVNCIKCIKPVIDEPSSLTG